MCICLSITATWTRPVAGWSRNWGGAAGCAIRAARQLDIRALCIIRETLARHDGLADFAFAMQGLGMGAVTLFGMRGNGRGWTGRGQARPFRPLR